MNSDLWTGARRVMDQVWGPRKAYGSTSRLGPRQRQGSGCRGWPGIGDIRFSTRELSQTSQRWSCTRLQRETTRYPRAKPHAVMSTDTAGTNGLRGWARPHFHGLDIPVCAHQVADGDAVGALNLIVRDPLDDIRQLQSGHEHSA